jgi:hypothetical protein
VVRRNEKRINGAEVGVSEKIRKKNWRQSHTQVGQSLIVKLTTTHNQTVSTFDFEGGCDVHTCGQTVQTEGGVRVIWDYIKNTKISISGAIKF